MKNRFLAFFLLIFLIGYSHPMPNSVLLFDVKSDKILCELQLPLKELQPAVPFDVTNDLDGLLKKHQSEIYRYILDHFHIKGKTGKDWPLLISHIKLAKAEQTATGIYQELIASIIITPAPDDATRNFTVYYDAIMHQVVTHQAIVSIRQDWENGLISENSTEIAAISMNNRVGKVYPLRINLAKGNSWIGFKSMVCLGMEHISEGTDHLLFLLVLLLSAPLIAQNGKWAKSGNTKYSLLRILKITLAFTIGHSITLFLGSAGWIAVQPKPIEILIAVSILITAIHAIWPLFPNKEMFVAAGFGLIHGLAFATILSNLNLESGKLALSLLGFNLGIELMQIFIIFLVIPWFILLSKYRIYTAVRLTGAAIAITAALSWASERYFEKPNCISEAIQRSSENFIWVIFALALFSLIYGSLQKARS
ncbi:MAG: HupE/UreJ family protein [Flavobacterium sp.]